MTGGIKRKNKKKRGIRTEDSKSQNKVIAGYVSLIMYAGGKESIL